MTIDAVAAVGAPAAGIAVDADGLRSVTLAEMISTRVQAGGTSTLGALGLAQVPAITFGTAAGASSSTRVPAALAAYGNGRIPRELLTLIGIGQHRLWGPAAQAFIAMRAAAAADGVTIGVTDSYRTYDQQVTLAEKKGLTKNGGWAATPGKSEHGWGLAVDVDVDAAGLAWLRANGARFGYVEPTSREPWHWEFHGAT